MNRLAVCLRAVCLRAVCLGIALLAIGCSERTSSDSSADQRPSVAYVTNCVASFWVIAEAGVIKGGEEFNADVDVLMPTEGITDQTRIIEDLMAKGVDGISVTAIDPENQIDLLNRAAKHTHLITHDSDAPGSNRECYIGMDNYLAGRLCGELVKEALPDGGKVALFIGRMDQDNARRRRQGVIDAVLSRSVDATRADPSDTPIIEGDWNIVGTYTDKTNFSAAKANVEDVISRHPDIAGMVGMFSYNPPLILEALKQANRLGGIKVIAFDEADETLAGIQAGTVYGTVVQNPFEYGRQSVRILAGLARGKSLAELEIPESHFLNIPAQQIRSDNVDQYWAQLKTLLGDTP